MQLLRCSLICMCPSRVGVLLMGMQHAAKSRYLTSHESTPMSRPTSMISLTVQIPIAARPGVSEQPRLGPIGPTPMLMHAVLAHRQCMGQMDHALTQTPAAAAPSASELPYPRICMACREGRGLPGSGLAGWQPDRPAVQEILPTSPAVGQDAGNRLRLQACVYPIPVSFQLEW